MSTLDFVYAWIFVGLGTAVQFASLTTPKRLCAAAFIFIGGVGVGQFLALHQ